MFIDDKPAELLYRRIWVKHMSGYHTSSAQLLVTENTIKQQKSIKNHCIRLNYDPFDPILHIAIIIFSGMDIYYLVTTFFTF